jgi:hypothetical protein
MSRYVSEQPVFLIFIIGHLLLKVKQGEFNVKKLAVILAVLFLSLPLAADLGEGELSSYKSLFMKRIIAGNPGRESDIRRCMDGIIKDGSAGVRLIDKFGLFLYDSRRNGLALEKIKFLRDGHLYIFMITLKDNADGALYNLFLEYSYDSGRGAYSLTDISFSMVFSDKIKSVSEFFGGG